MTVLQRTVWRSFELEPWRMIKVKYVNELKKNWLNFSLRYYRSGITYTSRCVLRTADWLWVSNAVAGRSSIWEFGNYFTCLARTFISFGILKNSLFLKKKTNNFKDFVNVYFILSKFYFIPPCSPFSYPPSPSYPFSPFVLLDSFILRSCHMYVHDFMYLYKI